MADEAVNLDDTSADGGVPETTDNAQATQDGTGDTESQTTTTFLDTIQDETLREQLKDYTDPNALAKDFLDLKNSQPNIPDTPDGYEMEWPDGVQMDEQGFNDFKALAHELKIPPDSWQKIVAFDIERSKAVGAQIDAEIEKAETELKTDWGDKFDENMDRAKRVLEMSESTGLTAEDIGNSPALARHLVWVADKVLEDNSQQGGTGPSGGQELGEDGKPLLHFDDMD